MTETPEFDWQKSDYRSFEIGQVFSRAFSAIIDRLHEIWLPVIGGYFLWGVAMAAFPYLLKQDLGGAIIPLSMGMILLIVASIFLQMTLVLLFVEHMWGQSIHIRDAFARAIPRVWAVLGVSLCMIFGILIGFILLIIPGLILYCGWYVALPVVIGERRGPVESLTRSWELTRGHKWQIAGLVLIALLIGGIIGGILGAIGGYLTSAEAVAMEAYAAQSDVLIYSIFQATGTMIASLISVAIIASTYVELMHVCGEYSPKVADETAA